MARHTDAVCRLCRREGMKLFLKSTRCDTPKCAIERREYPPGMHQWKKGKPSSYGIRLREKQKLKRYYGVLERQFRRLFAIAGRTPGNTGEALLSLLERRLDNIVCRLGLAGSRAQARQLVRHGHVLVNRRRVDIPSFLVHIGDTISIKNRPRSMAMVKSRFEGTTPSVPDFLELTSTEPPEGKVLRLPGASDVSVPVQVQLVVEMLSK
jgi:small subunit ribosomal protein S4